MVERTDETIRLHDLRDRIAELDIITNLTNPPVYMDFTGNAASVGRVGPR
jgi:hypothetical protein